MGESTLDGLLEFRVATEAELHGELVGEIILNRDQIGYQQDPRAEDILARLAKARESRAKPRRDEKIVVNWNGMMISGFVRAALVLEEDRYARAAINAGNFIWDNMRADDGSLYRNYFNGRAAIAAELVDYTYLARAYVALTVMSPRVAWPRLHLSCWFSLVGYR